MTPILFTSKTCPITSDFELYASIFGIDFKVENIEDNNPHALTDTPSVSHEGKVHIGLDNCTAFVRRRFKANS